MVHEEDVLLNSASGSYAVRILRPAELTTGVLVYFHGGGWVVGDADSTTTLGRHLAGSSEMTVLIVDYRLAPENPFPAAVDDAVHATQWALDNVERLTGRSAAPVAVAGDSAGGNLATVTALRLGAESGGTNPLAAQVLLYPVTDAGQNTPSYLNPENQLILSAGSMAYFWDQYVPDHAQRSHPDASPLRSKQLATSPPTLIVSAPHDVLLDEGKAYADGLAAAGVSTDFIVVEGQMHGFISNINSLPEALNTVTRVSEYLKKVLAKESMK
jgi:acetyl esterase